MNKNSAIKNELLIFFVSLVILTFIYNYISYRLGFQHYELAGGLTLIPMTCF